MKSTTVLSTVLFISGMVSFSSLFAQDNTLPQTGNVGIGTLSPTARLNVNGRAVIDSALVVKDSINVQKDLIVEENVRIEGKLVVYDNSVARRNFKIKGDLKLPNISVDSTSTKILMLDNTNTARAMDFNTFAKKVTDFSYDPHPNTLNICDIPGYTDAPVWHNGPQKLYSECPDVNVGIATANPRVNLDVRGFAYAYRMYLGTADPTAQGAPLFELKSPDSETDKSLFVIQNDSRKLVQVWNNGLLQAREIRIDALTWADFVFKPDYELKPLKDVESYIQAHGHLPDVPSEAEVKENGINLAKMNAVLLQKVEELTLHAIEQEKRIAELERQMETLKEPK